MAFSNHDVKPDTPINNFATLNPLVDSPATLTNGNLQFLGINPNYCTTLSTFCLHHGKKWYWEILATDDDSCTGIATESANLSGTTGYLGSDAHGYVYFGHNGQKYHNNTGSSYSQQFGNGDVIGVLYNGINNTLSYYKNGVSLGIAFSSLSTTEKYFIAVSEAAGGGAITTYLNCGQDATFAGNKTPTKVYTDSNGQGRFYYEPPVGALALCSRNIDTPKNVPSTYIVDETNANMLTYNGNAEISTFSPYATDGYSLYSNNAGLKLTNSAANFNYLHTNTTHYTISFWMYRMKDMGTSEIILDSAGGTTSQTGFNMIVDGGGTDKLRIYINGGTVGSSAFKFESNYVVPLRKWVHVSFVFDYNASTSSDKGKLYIDGSLYDSGTHLNNNTFSSSDADHILTLGSDDAGTTEFYGYIADFRIVKEQVHTQNYTPPSLTDYSVSKSNQDILISASSNGIKDSNTTVTAKTVTPVGSGEVSIEAWSPYTSIDKQTGFELPATTNGGSIKLDGSGDYISTSGDNVDFGTSGSPFTLEAWVYPTTSTQGTNAGIVGSYSSAVDDTGFDLTASYSGNQVYSVYVGSGSAAWSQFQTAPKPYQWQHVAVTRDTSGNIRLFVDGVRDGRLDVAGSGDISSSNKQLRIGYFWGNQYYNGYITNVRLSDNVRYPDVSTNFTPPSQKFVSDSNTLFLYQPFQPKSSVNSSVFNITDSYNKDETDKNLTYVNDARVVDESPYKGGSHGSFSLNGSDEGVEYSNGVDISLDADFTIEMWVKHNDTSNGVYLGNNITGGIYFQYNGNKLQFGMSNSGYGFYTSAFTVVADRWYHMAVSRTGSTIKCFINGVEYSITESGSVNDTFLLNSSSANVRLGSNVSGGPGYHFGLITDFRVVKGQGFYAAAFTPPAFPLRTDKYSTDGSDPSGGSNITGTVSLFAQPGKVENTDNEAAKDPDAFFKTVVWTGKTVGDDATSKTTGSDPILTVTTGFQPDLVWAKIRAGTTGPHNLYDSLRVESNGNHNIVYTTGAPQSTTPNGFEDIISTGFTLNETDGGGGDVNGATDRTYCAWCWKAGGEPSTDGKIKIDGTESNISNLVTSTGASLTPARISANTKAGFSIIKYVGTKTSGGSDTMPHGLNSAPEVLLMRNLVHNAGWSVYSVHINGGGYLDNSKFESGRLSWMINNTNPTPSLIHIGHNSNNVNQNGEDHIIYAWHSVPGYSKMGSYLSNANADGPFVYTGFKPAWVMVKSAISVPSGSTGSYGTYYIFDNKRGSFLGNGGWDYIKAAEDGVEGGASGRLDFLSNGFKLRYASGELNEANRIFLYMAFAELPSSYARGV